MIYDESHPLLKKYECLPFTLENWLDCWYPSICSLLSIDPLTDSIALERIVPFSSSQPVVSRLRYEQNKTAYVVAPSSKINEDSSFLFDGKKRFIVSVDGATSYVLKKNVLPDLIVTDLDGNISDQLKACNEGSILLVHVHGDNINTILDNIDLLSASSTVFFTTQTTPKPSISNYFGFTDGDRAVCFLTHLNFESIILLGYDYDSGIIGKYSKSYLSPELVEKKKKKFSIAKSILNWCSYSHPNTIRFNS